MNEVAHSGRTVLFVQPQIRPFEELCPRSLLLKKGRIETRVRTTRWWPYLSSSTALVGWTFGDRNGSARHRPRPALRGWTWHRRRRRTPRTR